MDERYVPTIIKDRPEVRAWAPIGKPIPAQEPDEEVVIVDISTDQKLLERPYVTKDDFKDD